MEEQGEHKLKQREKDSPRRSRTGKTLGNRRRHADSRGTPGNPWTQKATETVE